MRDGILSELATLFIQMLQALTKKTLLKQFDIWIQLHLRKAKLTGIKHLILPMYLAEHAGLLNLMMF